MKEPVIYIYIYIRFDLIEGPHSHSDMKFWYTYKSYSSHILDFLDHQKGQEAWNTDTRKERE